MTKIYIELDGVRYKSTVYCGDNSYPKVNIKGKNYSVHVLVWEAANGKKPAGHIIHHKDCNKQNYELSNLELVTYTEHRRIHSGWIKTDGKWTHRPCNKCGELQLLEECYRIRVGDRFRYFCKECQKGAMERFMTTEKHIQYIKQHRYKQRMTKSKAARELGMYGYAAKKLAAWKKEYEGG